MVTGQGSPSAVKCPRFHGHRSGFTSCCDVSKVPWSEVRVHLLLYLLRRMTPHSSFLTISSCPVLLSAFFVATFFLFYRPIHLHSSATLFNHDPSWKATTYLVPANNNLTTTVTWEHRKRRQRNLDKPVLNKTKIVSVSKEEEDKEIGINLCSTRPRLNMFRKKKTTKKSRPICA